MIPQVPSLAERLETDADAWADVSDDHEDCFTTTASLERECAAELRRLEGELAEERAPLSKEEWEQLFSLATGAPYPTKTPDACLIRGLQAWAENAHGRVAMRRLLEEHEAVRAENARLREALAECHRAGCPAAGAALAPAKGGEEEEKR